MQNFSLIFGQNANHDVNYAIIFIGVMQIKYGVSVA